MGIELDNLRPADLARLLNSTPLGTVVDERTLIARRIEAGFRVGDGRRVSLLRYAAWVFERLRQGGGMTDGLGASMFAGDDLPERRDPRGRKRVWASDAERKREERRAASSRDGELGELPPVADPARRAACLEDWPTALRTYWPHVYRAPFSTDHLTLLDDVRHAIECGGQTAIACGRGFGKSSLVRGAAVLAIAGGLLRYVVLVAASAPLTKKMINSLRAMLKAPAFAEDFPEIAVPIAALGRGRGMKDRGDAQTYRGEPTHVEWLADATVLPHIPGTAADNQVIECITLQGSMRGMSRNIRGCEEVRPDFAIVDDPDTKRTAHSPLMTQERQDIILADAGCLGGLDRRNGVVVTCTVMCPGCAADVFTDPLQSPTWHSRRFKSLRSFPQNTGWWEEFRRLYALDQQAEGRPTRHAHELYVAEREIADAGAVVSWPEGYDAARYASAVEFLMTEWIKNEKVFFSEFQNEPLAASRKAIVELTAADVALRLSGLPRGVVPPGATNLAGFVDVGQEKLHWMLVASSPRYEAWVVDYGAEPEGAQRMWWNGAPEDRDAAIARHLGPLLERLAGPLRLAGGSGTMRPDRIHVDANWSQTAGVVYSLAAGERWGVPVLPSIGVAHHKYRLPRGRSVREGIDTYNDHYKGKGRVARHDADVWRERAQRWLSSPAGAPGSVLLFGGAGTNHRVIASHFTAERLVEIARDSDGKERYVWESKERNHWLDCLTGSLSALSFEGVALPGTDGAPGAKGRRRTFSREDLARSFGGGM